MIPYTDATAIGPTAESREQVNLEDAPLTQFHLLVTLAGTGGQFSDGFILGIIGIALAVAAPQLHLNAYWLGLLGAASLAGLFVGSLVAGPLVDRAGRRAVFNYDMALFSIISLAQYWVTNPGQLLVLRLLLGVILGFDYVVSKAMLIEYSPRRMRGRLLSWLAIAWTLGYTGAYIVGYVLKDHGVDVWRLMLLSSAIPSAVAFLLRVRVPESPLWLQRKGRLTEAQAIVRTRIGVNVILSPIGPSVVPSGMAGVASLFSKKWRVRLFVACFSYMCLVIPYFSLGTFSPMVFDSMHIANKFIAGLIYNLFLLIGAIGGTLLVDRVGRRTFLLTGFFLAASSLAALSLGNSLPDTLIVALFAIFACVLSGTNNLVFLYPQELFPTNVRATGLGFAVAASRLGSASATFALPTIVTAYGGPTAVLLCIAVLVVGGVTCAFLAPETRHESLVG
ncbi:MFS transporter [Paraburkholderia sp. Cy-641]|uniref:MFS transporter n=1 Tax=Paraburkholderia sp. Cy-641 TaxID=2608337 RepID=UPI0014234DA4|nr:MFS transporter [Paraburkholderia sp. Cy-641]NIF77658.1 MFS transporter [Paraburkholderia sp. Cy-641]